MPEKKGLWVVQVKDQGEREDLLRVNKEMGSSVTMVSATTQPGEGFIARYDVQFGENGASETVRDWRQRLLGWIR